MRSIEENEVLLPNFKGKWEMALFILLIVLVILSPCYTHYFVTRQNAYEAVPLRMGPYDYFEQEIFHSDEPIDVLLLGSSDMWTSYDPKVLQEEWKSITGKDHNILMIAANWRGYDRLYFSLKDLLERRNVKLVILSIFGKSEIPHQSSKYLINFFSHITDLNKLRLKHKIALYAESLLGCPRLLLTLLRPETLDPNSVSKYKDTMGALYYESKNERTDTAPRLTFSDIAYKGDGNTYNYYEAPYDSMSKFEKHFYKLIVQLCKEKNVKLALIQTPLLAGDPNQDKVKLHQWSYDKDIPTIGLPFNKLFPKMEQKSIEDFYYNDTHMNTSGNKYFTKAISNALYEIYSE